MAQHKMIDQHHGKKLKLGVQQVGLFVVLLIAFTFLIYRYLIPNIISGFVIMNFAPSGEKALKVGFVSFEGLVDASVPKEKEAEFKAKKQKVAKALLTKDYIFDFTFDKREEGIAGYEKEGGLMGHWYAKCDALGENPIILQPFLGFSILAFVIGLVIALVLTILLPNSLGFMAVLFDRQIDNTKIKIRLQTGFSNDIVELLTLPDSKLAEREINEVKSHFHIIWDRTYGETSTHSPTQAAFTKFDDVFDDFVDLVKFRQDFLYERIREFFSDFVLKEIEDTRDGVMWRESHWLIGAGLRLYMAHHFTEKYANNVTALAYGGAAFLIVAVGIRGLKFIPAQKPSFILLAIFLEFSMLALMAITMFYTEEEERMDKMLKKMEDANSKQLDVLRLQQADIQLLSSVLVGQASEIIKERIQKAVVEYLTKENKLKDVIGENIGEFLQEALRSVAITESDKAKRTLNH